MIAVDTRKCVGCGTCAAVCPYGALYVSRTGHCAVVWTLCHTGCRACISACTRGALACVPPAHTNLPTRAARAAGASPHG